MLFGKFKTDFNNHFKVAEDNPDIDLIEELQYMMVGTAGRDSGIIHGHLSSPGRESSMFNYCAVSFSGVKAGPWVYNQSVLRSC
jgi:hypothetical protein